MIKIVRTTSENADFRNLVKSLDQELWSRYGDLQAQYDQHNKIEENKTVVVAYIGDEPVGCACMKQFDNNAIEVKRMFVKDTHRGKGIGHAILRELEKWASEKSYQRAVLETGLQQPEAIALYKKAGYSVIDNYEPYIGMEQSVCMAKKLNTNPKSISLYPGKDNGSQQEEQTFL